MIQSYVSNKRNRDVGAVLNGRRWSQGISTEELVCKAGILGVVLIFFFYHLGRWQPSKDTAFIIFVFWSVEFRVSWPTVCPGGSKRLQAPAVIMQPELLLPVTNTQVCSCICEMHPGSCNEGGWHISLRTGSLCSDCVAGRLLAWWAWILGGYTCCCSYEKCLYTSFGQNEQNNQTGLLKVFAPTTK